MSYDLDLHVHSYYSDGKCSPGEMVASAKRADPQIAQMALSDHNTFAGCREFLAVCEAHQIEGFASAEVSGSHPDLPHIEFHFLVNFGTELTDDVTGRTEMFIPWFNRLTEVDHRNIFMFLAAAARQGTTIPYHQVVRKAAEFYIEDPANRDPGLIKPPTFNHLRRVIRETALNSQSSLGSVGFEQEVWGRAGIEPLPTPPITEAYPIFRRASPAVTLAHPMKHPLTPEEFRPLIEEWQREMGLIAIEAHYGGVFDPGYKALADELGLLVSVGSDIHWSYDSARPHGSVPAVERAQADIPSLLDALRGAGGAQVARGNG